MSRAGLAEDLIRLRRKYRTLARLRERREAAEAAGLPGFTGEEAASRTIAFRRVAREFPGALRELDLSSADLLMRKAAAVHDEILKLRSDPDRTAPERVWVGIVIDYHREMREALAVKMWLSRRRGSGDVITDDLIGAFRAWRRGRARGRVGGGPVEKAFLDRHRRPPGGRLHTLVWESLSRKYGLEKRDLERAVFGEIAGPRAGAGSGRRGRRS